MKIIKHLIFADIVGVLVFLAALMIALVMDETVPGFNHAEFEFMIGLGIFLGFATGLAYLAGQAWAWRRYRSSIPVIRNMFLGGIAGFIGFCSMMIPALIMDEVIPGFGNAEVEVMMMLAVLLGLTLALGYLAIQFVLWKRSVSENQDNLNHATSSRPNNAEDRQQEMLVLQKVLTTLDSMERRTAALEGVIGDRLDHFTAYPDHERQPYHA